VRLWVVNEIEGREGRDAWRDAHRLDAEKKHHRPQEVDQLAGDEKRAQRYRGRRPLGGKSDSEVADKH